MYGNPAPGPSRRPGNAPMNVAPPQIRTAQAQAVQGNPMANQGAPSSRVGEMLDQIKAEYEAAIQQLNIAKMEQLDTERKIQAQVVEMDQIQQTLKTLEANHRRIRQQYEDDMMRMRHQLEGQQVQAQVQTQNKPPSKRHRPSPSPAEEAAAAAAMANANASIGAPRPTPSPMRAPQVPTSGQSLAALQTQNHPQAQNHPQQVQSSQPPPHLAPLDPQAQGQGPSRRIPSLREQEQSQNGRDKVEGRPLPSVGSAGNAGSDSARSSPSKTKVEGSSAGAANGKAMLPSITRESSNGGGESSPSSTTSGHGPQASGSATTPTTSGSAKPVTPPSAGQSASAAASSGGSNAQVKSTSSKASKLNWNCVYNNSNRYPDSERPVAEMHQSMDHQSVVCCVRFSSDGTMMASGCHKTAQVFDVKTGDRKFIVSRPGGAGGADGSASSEADDAYVRAVCFSPDCTKLVAGMPHNTIRVWDIASNEEGVAMTGHESEIYSLDYVNDLIVSGSGDRKVRLWDARNGQCKKVFGSESGGPSDGVTSVALSPDGRLLAAASLDKVVRIWDTESSQLLDRFEGHSDSVYSIAFSPDGKNVISGSLDRNIMLWDVNAQGRTTSRPHMVLQGHKDFVLSVAYTPDGRWLMSGSKDRSVVFWDPRSSRSVLTLTGYRNSVISVASSPASPYFATGSGDCFAVVWKYQCQSF